MREEKYIMENHGPGDREKVSTSGQYPDADMELLIQITRCIKENGSVDTVS